MTGLVRRGALCVLVAVSLVGLAASPRAETVRVERGETDVGAGWLFVHGLDGICRLATPLHVASRDGAALPHLGVVLRDGRRLDAVAPIIPDPSTDIAFYEVTFPKGRAPCTESRLGLDNLAKLLAQTSTATLVSADSSQIRLREVAIDATDVDEDQGRLFTIRLRGEGEQIQQGMSGSAVVVGQTPLGLLLATSEVDGTLGIVLRFDAIKRLFVSASATLASRPSSAPAGVASLSRGQQVSTDPLNALSSGGSATIRPTNRRAEIELHLPEPQKLRSVTLAIDPSETGEGLAVSLRTARSAGAEGGWTPAARCRPAGQAWVCPIGDRTIARLSLVIVSAADEAMTISGIRLEGAD